MAVQLATAYVQILPSTRGFGSALSRGVGREGSTQGREVGRRFSGGIVSSIRSGLRYVPALLAGGLAMKGISTAFGFAKDAVFGFNSTLQQSRIAFTTMLGSGRKAKTFLAQLQAFAKATPFEFEGLVQNSQTLLGMGVNARDIIPDLTALGDSVASVGGSGEQLNQVILAFGQTMAKGTLDMGNMNQLLQGGIPTALKVLASSYHVTTGEMVKMISAGKVQSSDALPRLVKGLEQGTSSTAALGGMMDKQSKTFEGALSNISDSLTQSIAKAFRPFFSAASSGLQGLATWLGSPSFDAFSKRVTSALTTAGAAIVKLKPIAIAIFQKVIVPAVRSAIAIFGNLWSGVQSLWKVVQPLVVTIGKALAAAFVVLFAAMKRVSSIFAGVAGWMSKHATLTRTLVVALGAAVAVWAAYRIAIATWNAIVRIATAVQVAFNAVMAANPIVLVIAALAALAAAFVYAYNHSKTFRDIVQRVWKAVKGAFVAAWHVIRGVFNALKTAVKVYVALWRLQFNIAKTIVLTVFRAIKAVISAVIGAIKGTIRAGLNFITGTVRSVGNTIRSVWSGVWNGVRNAVSSVWDRIHGIVAGAINRVWSIIRTVGHKIHAAWSTIWGGIQDVVLRVVGTIKAIAQGMWDGITSGLKAVVNGGIHIINFAISGINHLIDIANDIPFVDIPHISEIPYLARGGMTTGPMAAIIGDNPNGQEVVLPTDSPRTVAALSAALEKAGARNGGPGGGVSFEINEATDADAVAAQVLRRMRLVGAV